MATAILARSKFSNPGPTRWRRAEPGDNNREPAMSYEQIRCETDGPLLIVTLNRPDKLNAYTGAMGAEITDAFQRADADDGVRAVIVTGAGRAFCAGADVSGGAKSFDTSGSHGA